MGLDRDKWFSLTQHRDGIVDRCRGHGLHFARTSMVEGSIFRTLACSPWAILEVGDCGAGVSSASADMRYAVTRAAKDGASDSLRNHSPYFIEIVLHMIAVFYQTHIRLASNTPKYLPITLGKETR